MYVPVPVITGRVFRTDRSLEPPMYAAETPMYTARMIMGHGLPVYLEDPDGHVRLVGPLFTYTCEAGVPVLREKPLGGYVWGGLRMTGQGSNIDHAPRRDSRFTLTFEEDRIIVGIVRAWTNFNEAHFTIPENCVSPNGQPVWKRIIGLDAEGNNRDVNANYDGRIVAAELEFPGADWNIAFSFNPVQEVSFEGTQMKFAIDVTAKDTWSLGFVRPGGLDAWRK